MPSYVDECEVAATEIKDVCSHLISIGAIVLPLGLGLIQKLSLVAVFSGQMCQGRNPGQIRHGDKTVPCCQLMGAKSKPS